MKLTNAIRDAIIAAVLKDVFAGREAELTRKEGELGDAVYSHFFGTLDADMLKFPEGFFADQQTAQFKIGDRYTIYELRMAQRRRVSYRSYVSIFGIFPENAPLVAAYHDFRAAQISLSKEKEQLKSTTRQLVYSATTDKKLLELWPEGEKYLPKIPVVTVNLPSVTAVNLNSLIAQYKKVA